LALPSSVRVRAWADDNRRSGLALSSATSFSSEFGPDAMTVEHPAEVFPVRVGATTRRDVVSPVRVAF